MKPAPLLINAVAFLSLFAVYSMPMGEHHLTGVRRLLQTYAGQLPTGAFPTRKPVWELGLEWSEEV